MFDLSIRQQKELFFFSVIALLFVYPIINANIYYGDDLYRIRTGETDWEGLGRPLAAILQRLISVSIFERLRDIAPLTHILSSGVLALSAFKFNEYLKREHDNGLIWLSVIIIINPFFLMNLSYRFDSFGMALGLYLVVMAFCLPIKSKIGSVGSIIILIASISLYQPNINMFLALAAVEMVLFSKDATLAIIVNRLYIRIIQYCSSFVLYYLTIAQLFSNLNTRGKMVEFSFHGLEQSVVNFQQFIKLGMNFFVPSVLFYVSVFIVFTAIGFMRFIYANDNKKVLIISLAAALFIYLISLSGPMVLLQSPIVGYRTMPSFYMFAAIFIAASSICRRGFLYVWLIPIVLSIVVSYQYGVALKNQRDYDENIMNLIQYDLLNHHIDHRPTYVLGRLMRAPHAERISKSQVFIDHIVHPAGGGVAASLLKEKGLEEVQFVWSDLPEFKDDVCNGSTNEITHNSLYSIFTVSNKNYILLSMDKANYCDT